MEPLVFLIVSLVFLALFAFVILFILGAPFASSSGRAVRAMVDLGEPLSGKTVYDVGSGDGRVALGAAARGARAVGIEINPFLVLLSRLRARRLPEEKRPQFICGNFWQRDLSQANIIFFYLPPGLTTRMTEKIRTECKQGTLVITNSAIIRGWEPAGRNDDAHVFAFRLPPSL